MASPVSPTDQLRKLRSILVEQRRYVVNDVFSLRGANNEQDHPTSGYGRGAEIKVLQEQIEAIDRAIADEETLAKT